MPPGLVEQHHRMPTRLDHPRDLGQVQVNRAGFVGGLNT
jgi:hypothetical protein